MNLVTSPVDYGMENQARNQQNPDTNANNKMERRNKLIKTISTIFSHYSILPANTFSKFHVHFVDNLAIKERRFETCQRWNSLSFTERLKGERMI